MTLKIYSYPQNPRVFRALIAGQYNGIEIETTPDFQMGKDNKTKEFLALNPNGKVPVLVTDDGPIFETNAIARFVAHANPTTQLFGANAYESGLVEQWIDWTNGELDLPAAAWIYPILGFVPNNEQATTKAKSEIRKALALLNTHLLSRTFLVGERVTLADIVVSMSLLPLYRMVFDATFRKPFINVNRWFLTCINQPQFKAVLGTVDLCVTAQVAPAASAAPAPAAAAEPKPKAEKKPKAPAAAPAAGNDDDEEAEKPKPKAKNPLDLLPPTPFVLDEWKRFYSNAESTKNDAMPWFWEHYDPAGWSLWLSDYKHNEENTVLFQTCNLAGGYCQRLEELRKYGFGSILILGEKAPYEISCCWLVRGQEIPPELSGCPDSELYTFTRVDHTNPEQRELVEDFWAWEGKFAGHTSNVVADGKTFK